MKTYVRAVLTIIVALAVCPFPVWSQATSGIVVGTVTDASGGSVPGATLQAENVATGVRFTATSDNNGNYRFENLPVGTYRITANATGFQTTRVERVSVELNRTSTINLSVQVASVSEAIEVTEAAAAIDTTTSQVQTTFQEKQVVDLPVAAFPLGPLNMSLLAAGVSSSGGTGLGEGPSVGGQRPRNNSFNVEGIDNNRKDVTGSNMRIPNEATQEVTILLNQYSAEFGHAGGGVFNTTLKSGTNDLHGTLYEYFQNRNLNAVDESNKRQGIFDNPRFDDNRFGGNVGGPVIRNRVFFFGNVEFNPVGRAGSPSSAFRAPTAAGYAALDRIQGLSSTNLQILKTYVGTAPTVSGPPSTVNGVPIELGILPINYPSFENNRNWLISMDWHASERDQIRGRFISSRNSGFYVETTPDLPVFNQQRLISGKLASLNWFHTFSPNVINEVRAGYNRYNDNIPAGNFEFPGLNMFPNLTFQDDLGVNVGPLGIAPQNGVINTYQLVDNVTWNKGSHSLKFGGEGRKYIAPTNFIQRVRGDYIYTTIERYLLDLSPDVLGERNFGGVPFSGNSLSFYTFANDNWRVTQNLTLNLGLRWEYKGIAEGDKLQALNAVSNVPGLIEFRAPEPQYTNFAPRVGFAYSPGTSGRTSIRGGFAMAYDNYPDNFGTLSKPPQLETTVSYNTNVTQNNFLRNGGLQNPGVGQELSAEEARELTTAYIADQKLPYSLSWSIGVQRQFAGDYTVEVRYLGTRGVHLFTQNRLNWGRAPVTPDRSLPTFFSEPSAAQVNALTTTLADLQTLSFYQPAFEAAGFTAPMFVVDSRGNSVYHGLQTEFTKRYSAGLWLKAAYTWSKTIDDSTADLFSTILSPRRPQDFQDMRAERSRSFLDRTHRFTYSWIYDLRPFQGERWFLRNVIGNWTFGGVYTYESPQYATVQSGIDSNLNGDSAGDRAIVNLGGDMNRGSAVRPVCKGGCPSGTVPPSAIVGYVAVDPTAGYVVAGRGVHPNAGRQTIATRPINNFDVNLRKVFNITERTNFQIGAVASNIFNHAQYVPGSINSVQSISTDTTNRQFVIPGSPIFNDPTRTFSSNPRQLYLVARFVF